MRNECFNLTRSVEGDVVRTSGLSLYDEVDIPSSIVSVDKWLFRNRAMNNHLLVKEIFTMHEEVSHLNVDDHRIFLILKLLVLFVF